MKKLETYDWWPDLVAQKDEKSLRELGQQFGVTAGAIMNALKRNGIQRKPARSGPKVKRSPPTEALPPEPGEARRGSKDGVLQKYEAQMGKVPDRVLAEKAGVSLRTVANYRAMKGIAGYRGPRRKSRRRRRSKIDPFAEIVGVVRDAEVAKRAGVSTNAVRNWRRQRGIPAARRSKAAAAATGLDSGGRAVASVSGSIAWKVEFEGGASVIVLGGSLSEAAARAEGAGQVTAMARLGTVLQ